MANGSNRRTKASIQDGINDKFLDTALVSDDYPPPGTAKNKPFEHPRAQQTWKGKGERFKSWRNGKSKPTKKLNKASQSYTKDGFNG